MTEGIRYCTTADGVSIAYRISGSADRWLVYPPNGVSASIPLSDVPGREDWTAMLRERFTVLEYDARGTGLSQRAVTEFPLESLQADLEAVVEAAGVPHPFVILGSLSGAWAAALYALAHPERVSHLVLWPAPFNDPRHPAYRPMAQMAVNDWDTFTEMYAHTAFGWARGGPAHAFALKMRETISQETFLRAYGQLGRLNQDETLERFRSVNVPTLIMQRPGFTDLARVANRFGNARVQLIAGDAAAPYIENPRESVDALLQFVGAAGEEPEAASPAHRAPGTGTAIILFTDIADSTPLTEQMGDAAFREASSALEAGIRSAMRDAGGTPVEGRVLGDGVMAVFASAAQAIDAARRCVAISAESELRLHVGVHAGDVIREGGNVYGGAVNIAARICGLCAPGEILVSGTVRELARTSAGVSFEDRGEQSLKGVADAVRVFAVV